MSRASLCRQPSSGDASSPTRPAIRCAMRAWRSKAPARPFRFLTDDDGRFVLPGAATAERVLAASKAGYAPMMRSSWSLW